jgi:3-hydroxybutyrate dehydrogenase
VSELNARSALVTGGGSGIGACIALALAGAGAKVTIIGRTQSPLESVASQHAGIDWSLCDVVDPVALANLLDRRGSFDIVVANAGYAVSKPFAAMETSDMQSMLDTNLLGVFNTWKATLAGMQDKGWGRLLTIASTAGLKGYPYVSAYCAAKHAVVGMVRSLALELATTNITVNAICPGFVDTPMLDRSLENISRQTGRSREAVATLVKANNPQNRFIQPGEVAQTVIWLCGAKSASINGQAISISGGEI